VESVRARQTAVGKTDTFVDAESTVALVGNRIREMRVERNLTLQALAERTGLSSSMLSLVERGKTSPSIGTLVAISYALGVHMTDLFDDDGAEEREPVVRFDDQLASAPRTRVPWAASCRRSRLGLVLLPRDRAYVRAPGEAAMLAQGVWPRGEDPACGSVAPDHLRNVRGFPGRRGTTG
jgi:transcriptional regulator with XRE-family HTH domain